MKTCPHCLSKVVSDAQVCASCGIPFPVPFELPTLTYLKNHDYQLNKVLGRGGFGITYLATDKRLNRQVAIKEFFPEGSSRVQTLVAHTDLGEFAEAKQRFLEEARVLARFEDSGIVRVFDVFEDNNTAYLVMEALQGKTLSHALESGAIQPDDVAQLAQNICRTLEVVHRAGWLHRDIKPDNIFITNDDRVVLIDFGSARMFRSNRTMHHTRLVTPGYAAPEQFASSAQFGAFTDIYGLSATLYHALTGNPPPSATDRFVGVAVPSLESDVPLGLKQAIEKGLALKVGERPQSAREFVGLIEAPARLSFASNPKVVRPTPILTSNIQSVASRPYYQHDYVQITVDEIILMPSLLNEFGKNFKKQDIWNIRFFERKNLQMFYLVFLLTFVAFLIAVLIIVPTMIGISTIFLLYTVIFISKRIQKPTISKRYEIVLILKDGSEAMIYQTSLLNQAQNVYKHVKEFLN